MSENASLPSVWTCPFCPLLCDDVQPDSACLRAQQRLQTLSHAPSTGPRVQGQAVPLEDALDVAAQWLRASRQPHVGGLGADVAGARALLPLVLELGAIADAEGGDALAQALMAQQDRGGYTTTLGEWCERADLVVFVGSWAPVRAPRLTERMRLAREAAGRALPTWAALGAADAPPQAEGAPVAQLPVTAADLPDALALLAALVAGRPMASAPPTLVGLAQSLRDARYAVLVWEPAQLGPQAGLLIERLQGLIGLLNQHTRAAGLPIGGGDGAATSLQVSTWLSGLPLRSRLTPAGLEHDARRWSTASLMNDDAIDLLVWVSSWGASPPPPAAARRLVLAPSALAAALGDESHTVFIPIAVPGVDVAGHLFRTDGVVMLPLHPLHPSHVTTAPTVAALAHALHERVQGPHRATSPIGRAA